MRKPLFCASRMAISAYVDRLRNDHGAPITTYFYTNPETGGRYGVYALTKPIRLTERAKEYA
ncbi:MAG: hypothetical protein COA37_04830 [Hoeflea sp.]|nr:MAG: hypothetical protein COA37_04830 [Hoeflea sp.]